MLQHEFPLPRSPAQPAGCPDAESEFRVITVVDPDAARRALLAGRLRCPEPGCEGVPRVWSRARARRVVGLDGGLIELRPDRARCRCCAVTQVLLPAWCLPRRGYHVEVVGAALLAGAEGAGQQGRADGLDVVAAPGQAPCRQQHLGHGAAPAAGPAGGRPRWWADRAATRPRP